MNVSVLNDIAHQHGIPEDRRTYRDIVLALLWDLEGTIVALEHATDDNERARLLDQRNRFHLDVIRAVGITDDAA